MRTVISLDIFIVSYAHMKMRHIQYNLFLEKATRIQQIQRMYYSSTFANYNRMAIKFLWRNLMLCFCKKILIKMLNLAFFHHKKQRYRVGILDSECFIDNSFDYAESTRKILKMHDGYLTEQEVTLIGDNKNAKKYKSLLLI